MKGKYAKYASNLAFLDMIYNLLIAFAFLFMVSFLQIHPPKDEHAGVKLSAEFVVTMTWPDDSIDDVDLWMLLPNGKKVNFHHKDVEYVTLDRDDRGAMGDITYDADGKAHLLEMNKEMMTIRALVPGRYVVASHMYATFKSVAGFPAKTTLPFTVKVNMLKLNPSITEVAKTEFILSKVGEQHTAFSFVLDGEGHVSDVQYETDDQIVDESAGQENSISDGPDGTRGGS